MQKISLTVLSLMLSFLCFSFSNDYFKTDQQNAALKIISVQNKIYAVSKHTVSLVDKKSLQVVAAINANCNDACVYNGNIAVATDSGIIIYDTRFKTTSYLLQEKINKKTEHVVSDVFGRLWFTQIFTGAYMIDDNLAVIPKVQSPVTYSIAATTDSVLWIGTNVGLYKIPYTTNEIFRYEEEGIEGFELPDNLVEEIYADEKSNVWVKLDEATAFIPGKNFEGEIPSFNFIGDSKNELFDIAYINLSSTSYLFATSDDLLFVPGLNQINTIRTGEIHQKFAERAIPLDHKITETPAALAKENIIKICFTKNETWFITDNGFWRVSSKKFIKNLLSLARTKDQQGK